jgi:DNA-binding PadR family transcriptional regulator
MTKNELVVLGFLKEGPMHGYQLYHEIEKRNMEAWAQVNLASIYNTLDRLRKATMVEARKEKPGRMPEREVFQITCKGKQRLATLVEEAITDDRMPENNFCVGVYFLFGLSKKKALECIDVKRKQMRELAKHLEKVKADLDLQSPSNRKFLLRYGMEHVQLDIKKIESLKRKISKLKSWS